MLILGDEEHNDYENFEKLDPPPAFLCFCQSTHQQCDLVQKGTASMGLCQQSPKSITSLLSLPAISSPVILASLLHLLQPSTIHAFSLHNRTTLSQTMFQLNTSHQKCNVTA